MKRSLIVAGFAAIVASALAGAPLAATQSGKPVPTEEEARQKAGMDARYQRLEAERRAADAAREAERLRYEQSVRDAEAARLRYEADLARNREAAARHQREVERANARRAEYDRRMAERAAEQSAEEAERAARRAERDARRERGRTESAAATPAAAPGSCQERQQRDRRRGRRVGGLIGGVAGMVGGPAGGAAGLVSRIVPVGALIGEAIASLLDCDEQEKAATATETAVERGVVGTTETWTSETRPGVTGSSTVTAVERTAGGEDCMTVTDVVIVDGEETRAPKRMCRRPPTNRYVRV